MTQPVEGRVYTRLIRFESFPADLQDDTKAFQEFLIKSKSNVFKTHHTMLMKSVYSVKGKKLIKSIETWLQSRQAGGQPPPSSTSSSTDAIPMRTTDEAAGTSAPTLNRDPTPAALPGAPLGGSQVPVPAEIRARASQIAESLVLAGFLTPHNDGTKYINAPHPDHYVDDHELLIPVAKEVSELKTTSVWSVLDGAIYAKALKRKAGVLAHFTHGKDVYVVFNERTKKAYLFESDLARECIAELDGGGCNVQFDHSFFEFGVLVTSASGDDETQKPELFNAGTKHLQEEFLNVWLNIGAQYREAYNVDVESVKSIYELKDCDIQGNEIAFDKYKGKVLLIVNVASNCGLTPKNYPELTVLDEKYRDQGLEILAFPCNQFGSEEPGTNEDIIEFVKQFNAQYQFFEKADVNGAHARPVFAFLKAKLPGTFGSYIKWNFTKFLVDRNGVPYKRFAPTDKPFSMEDEIMMLLDAQVQTSAAEGNTVDPLRAHWHVPDGGNLGSNATVTRHTPGHATSNTTAPFDRGVPSSTVDPMHNQYRNDADSINVCTNPMHQTPGHTTIHSRIPDHATGARAAPFAQNMNNNTKTHDPEWCASEPVRWAP